MPSLYLSPSTQEGNPYITGGSEEYYMNLLADELVPYLGANAIAYTRNTPDMTAVSSVAQANAGCYDLYLALHSNAAGPSSSGQVRGVLAFYYPTSANGLRAAELFVQNLKNIYPLPNLVHTISTTSLYEVARSRAPAVLLELGYHDNWEDAQWITGNLPAIARNLAQALAQYFGVPFFEPVDPWWGTVDIRWGSLNIRARPSTDAPLIGRAYAGEKLRVVGAGPGWYSVDHDGTLGYASAQYIR